MNTVPHGGMNSPSVLQCLHDALGLQAHLHNVHRQIEFSSEHAWIHHFTVTSLPSGSIGVQTSVLAILAGSENCEGDMEKAISSKLKN